MDSMESSICFLHNNLLILLNIVDRFLLCNFRLLYIKKKFLQLWLSLYFSGNYSITSLMICRGNSIENSTIGRLFTSDSSPRFQNSYSSDEIHTRLTVLYFQRRYASRDIDLTERRWRRGGISKGGRNSSDYWLPTIERYGDTRIFAWNSQECEHEWWKWEGNSKMWSNWSIDRIIGQW